MDNKDYTIYCSRCGAEMKASSRYCMKCGNLNYDHPDNASMKKMLGKEQKEASSYQVGSGKFILSDVSGNSNTVIKSIANNTGSKTVCFYVIFGVYFLFMLVNLGTVFFSGNFSIDSLVRNNFSSVAIISSLVFLYMYSLSLFYMKANKRWWAGFVPIYNVMILSEMAINKKMLGLLILVPGVGQIFMFYIFYKLGEKFKVSGLLMMFFGFVMIPFIGFSNQTYDGRVFEDDTPNATEKEYGRKRTAFIFAILFLIIGLCLYIYENISDVEATKKDAGNSYYVYASNKIIKKVKKSVEKGEISCDDVDFDRSTGTYYIPINDAGSEFNLFMQLLREPIEAYVKIENSNGETKYYISMTDREKGFPETQSDLVDAKTVIEYKELSRDYEKGNSCHINK